MKEWIVGRNPVYEILHARRRECFRLRLAIGIDEKGRLPDILQLAAQRKLAIERQPRDVLEQTGPHHQGVALETSGYPYSHLEAILGLAEKRGEAPFLLILDTLQDPQNLGALLRTAEATGVHGVLLPLRHTVTITPAVVHASSGACEHLLITQVNLAQAIAQLKKRDIWVIGLDASPQAHDISDARLDGALALVVGNEGEGLRRLIRDSCDLLVRLPMRGRVASLNAAVAGSIALYLAQQCRARSSGHE